MKLLLKNKLKMCFVEGKKICEISKRKRSEIKRKKKKTHKIIDNEKNS